MRKRTCLSKTFRSPCVRRSARKSACILIKAADGGLTPHRDSGVRRRLISVVRRQDHNVGENYGTGKFLCQPGCKRHRGVEALLRKAGVFSVRRKSVAELANNEEWQPQYRVVS